MYTKKLKLLTLMLTALFVIGCANTKDDKMEKINEQIGSSAFDRTMDSYEITSKKELNSIKKYDAINLYQEHSSNEREHLFYRKNEDYIYKHIGDKLYNQKILYNVGDFVKIDINKVSTSNDFTNFDNILLVYKTVNISPKLDVLYNDVSLKINDNKKFDIYGKIIIKNKNLSEEEKQFFEEYAKVFKDRMIYNDSIIVMKFNVSDDNEII
ncbi:hypothetical protein HZY83_02790 [Gemella sp. GH3]|uniref:hypothetical protein n=1 Tax=unclassified Gemella TaxID=2624949 RepID=UPI0015D0B259|nr:MULTISPECIES: hypothetical protein [unclassified Gemella]MBF0713607.1 hypothetical protein [Gemella sp. GH3.1]NYS50559.1 hypothetical protein [Gemella sp. GH3]